MTHAVAVLSKVAAQDIDSLNRSALGTADLDNGNVVVLATRNTGATRGYEEVWDATEPATATLSGVWMVYEPEVNVTLAAVGSSKKYKGINPDPRDFVNITGEVFSVFKPQLGDIIKLTADAMSNSRTAESYAVTQDGAYTLLWSTVGAGLSLKYLATEYVSIGTGDIGTQQVAAYLFEVVVL